MTELTARQQEPLDELLKDSNGDARNLFGEGGFAQGNRKARYRGGAGGRDESYFKIYVPAGISP